MKTFPQHQQSAHTRASFPLQRQYKGGSKPEVPKAIPPVTTTATEVTDAEREARLAAAKRKGMQSTLLAGGDAGAGLGGNAGGAKLLG